MGGREGTTLGMMDALYVGTPGTQLGRRVSRELAGMVNCGGRAVGRGSPEGLMGGGEGGGWAGCVEGVKVRYCAWSSAAATKCAAKDAQSPRPCGYCTRLCLELRGCNKVRCQRPKGLVALRLSARVGGHKYAHRWYGG